MSFEWLLLPQFNETNFVFSNSYAVLYSLQLYRRSFVMPMPPYLSFSRTYRFISESHYNIRPYTKFRSGFEIEYSG